jgi:hypothetical protein
MEMSADAPAFSVTTISSTWSMTNSTNRPLESDARRDMRHDRREPARPAELFVATLH